MATADPAPPILFLHGMATVTALAMPLIARLLGRADLDAIPGVDILELPAGHAPWLNDSARIGDAVSAFLDPQHPSD